MVLYEGDLKGVFFIGKVCVVDLSWINGYIIGVVVVVRGIYFCVKIIDLVVVGVDNVCKSLMSNGFICGGEGSFGQQVCFWCVIVKVVCIVFVGYFLLVVGGMIVVVNDFFKSIFDLWIKMGFCCVFVFFIVVCQWI